MDSVPPRASAPVRTLHGVGRAFDAAAMAAWPSVARAFGYTFASGTSPKLRADAHQVLDAVWALEGIPVSDSPVARRYDEATTWFVAYSGGAPVGSLGVLDMRIASLTLEMERCLLPPGLDLAHTREMGRLAVLPEHRGRAQAVTVGLLREMGAWCRAQGIDTLFGGSTKKSFELYCRLNPSGRLLQKLPDPAAEPEERARYWAATRAYAANQGVLFTFSVRGASPWALLSRVVKRRLRQRGLFR